jgi:flagellar assembly factor FliW
MILKTTRFGEIDYSKSEIITFFRGLPGFDDFMKFIIVETEPPSGLKWFQSLENSSLAFLVAESADLSSVYKVKLNQKDKQLIELNNDDDLKLYILLSISEGNPEEITANFHAPLAVNVKSKLAVQLITSNNSNSAEKSVYDILHSRNG